MIEDDTRAIDTLAADRKALYDKLRATEAHLVGWIYDLAVARKSDGIGASTQALERVGKRIDALEDRMNDGGGAPTLKRIVFDWGGDDADTGTSDST